MTSIIQHSSSIHNTFISTVDHLPCDIIRSLWLIQSCNICIAKNKKRLHRLLVQLTIDDPSSNKDELGKEIHLIKLKLLRLNAEAISEAQALYNQLITHKISLCDEVDQLRNIASKSHDLRHESDENEKLRAQLVEHYKENPLTSQREAQEEQDKTLNAKEKLAGTEKQGNSGIKLVLRLSGDKSKKSPKPLHKERKPRSGAEKRPRSGAEKRPRSGAEQRPKSGVERKPKNGADKKPKPSALSSRQPRHHEPHPKAVNEIPTVEEPKGKEEAEENTPFCFCRQPSFGDMIACDNEGSCPNGEWFHYKCVGLLNRVEALKYTTGKNKWFCSEHCRNEVTNRIKEKRKKKRRRW